jgi:TonB family protein
VRPLIRAARLAPLLIAAASCAGNPHAKQNIASGRRSGSDAGCLDTLRASDSLTAIVKITVTPVDPKTILPADFESLLAQEFRARFRLPAKLPLSVVMGVPPCDSLGSRCAGGILGMGAVAYVTARNNGKLSDIDVVDAALTPSFADSVTSVLNSISKASLAPPTGAADSIPFILDLSVDDLPDTVPEGRHVLRAKMPRYGAPFTYASMPTAGIDAKYPFRARLAGLGDSVTVAFTVDSDGMIAAESIELMSAGYRDFVASVADALLRTRYHPARLGDCRVATRMTQRFLFKVPE